MALIKLTGGVIAANTISATNIVSNINLGGGVSERPTVSTVTYPTGSTANTVGGQTMTLTGTKFASGIRIIIGNTVSSVVTVANSTSLTFTTPAKSAGTYIIYLMTADGSISLKVPGITYA